MCYNVLYVYNELKCVVESGFIESVTIFFTHVYFRVKLFLLLVCRFGWMLEPKYFILMPYVWDV